MQKTKVLIVEDDETASYLMADFLTTHGFNVDAVFTVTDGLSYLKMKKYDLLILDLNLPDYDGFDLLSNIKKDIAIPTIVVSAHNDTPTKVKAFKYGASDYLSKPIDFEELEARIWAILSRSNNIKLKNNNIFKIDKQNIYFKGSILKLTSLEFDILSYFITNQNISISREELCDEIYSISSHRLLDNHIKNIRKKIEVNSSQPNYLKTEYGKGYRFIE